MKNFVLLLLFSVIFGHSGFLGAAPASALTTGDPRCEYATNPLGVEALKPRLSWRLTSLARGQRQTAYQILVASSADALAAGKGDLWDSGKVVSDRSIQIPYGGQKLASRKRCFWKVRTWDREGRRGAFTEQAWWEMGLLDAKDWRAEWIGPPPGGDKTRARYFRFDFSANKPIRSARVYVAGLGYHELSVNGTKAGDNVLDPGWTEYTKRVLYLSHDVGPLLRPGANTLGVVVGNGWYGSPKLLLQLELVYADGSSARFFTAGGDARADLGGGWLVTTGPIISNSIFGGESYDARLEKPDWDAPLAGRVADLSTGWDKAVAIDPPGGKLVSQQLDPIKVVDSFVPVAVKQPSARVFVFDTGQNLAGWVEVRAKAPRGTRVTLKFAESVNPDGTVNQKNLRRAAATDTYVFKGSEAAEERWQPRFTYHGFRYVQVEGFPGDLGLSNISVKVVRSSVESAGAFVSSHDLLNRIYRMVRATEASNLHSVPTDCPQRDERMGWLNDMTVRIDQAMYNFQLGRFYDKFLYDIDDTQTPDGAITDTAPFKWGKRPADPVSASYLLLGWAMYQHYGDTQAMASHFAGFRGWVDFLASKTKDGLVTYGYYGDWSPPAAFSIPGSLGAGAVARDTPLLLMSTGYLYLTSSLLAQMAAVLNKPAEQRRYQELAQTTAHAFNQAYWNETKGGYGNNNQAANSFALFLGLVPAARVPRVVANLVSDVAKHDGHLTTGNLCTKYVLEMLTQHGHVDVALQVATQKTYPSWGFMLENGATTLWERWEHLLGGQMNSHNHPMMGSVGSWFYKYLAGILPDPAAPGFRRFIIQPHAVSGVDWVRASYNSMYGRIDSAWKKEDGHLHITVNVPVNATATVVVPTSNAGQVTEGGKPARSAPGVRFLREGGGTAVFELESGAYEFTAP